MPVFDAGKNVHDITGEELPCLFPELLIPTPSTSYQQYLSAFFSSLVDMPVVSASGLKGNIGRHDTFAGKNIEVAQSAEILPEGILFTSAKDHAIFQVGLHVFQAKNFKCFKSNKSSRKQKRQRKHCLSKSLAPTSASTKMSCYLIFALVGRRPIE
jgi:hypothetical protein